MTKLIIDISKYVLLVLIALYALQSYIIFKKKFSSNQFKTCTVQ